MLGEGGGAGCVECARGGRGGVCSVLEERGGV